MGDLLKTLKAKKNPLTFEMFGNWDLVQNKLNSLPEDLKKSGEQGQRKAAETFAKMVKQNILNDRVQGPSKTYNSSDGRKLINEEVYVHNIKAWRKNYIYYAGVKSGITQPKTHIEIATLAAIHEHGNSHLPARPVWGPTYKEFGGRVGAKKIIMQLIHKKLKKMAIAGFTIKHKDIF